jgi:hypothetical protein
MTTEYDSKERKLPENSSPENNNSMYNLLRGVLIFRDESQWVRIVLYSIMVLFFLGTFWLLKGAAIFAFLTNLSNAYPRPKFPQ